MPSPNLKLLKFPGPMDRGGRDSVAGLVHGVRRGSVKSVLCVYETADGTIHWFRHGMRGDRAVSNLEVVKLEIVREARQ